MKMKTLFGPVPSRRLGFSLGIDIIPFKVCSMDCIYCQLGKTTEKTVERGSYTSPDEVLDEWNQLQEKIGTIDCMAIAGSGEPTLNSQLGKLVERLKDSVNLPIAVLTNGSLLFQREVRQEMLKADIILPSLDAVTPGIFKKVNRPHPSLSIREIIRGLREFRTMYKGKIWLEFMVVKGVNDCPEELERMKETIHTIAPDKVQLNTVVRPGSEKGVKPLRFEELKRIQRYLGKRCEIITTMSRKGGSLCKENLEETIVSMVRRHPLTISEIIKMLGKKRGEVITCIHQLHGRNVIEVNCYQGRKYCRARTEPPAGQRVS